MAKILEWLSGVTLLRQNQRAEMKDERKALEEQIRQPLLGNRAGIQNPGALAQEIRKLDKQLATQSPKEITPAERDELAAKKRELEAEIIPGMPTHEEMRRNPPGTVHRHMEWEKANKPKIRLWKNVAIQLDPESSDGDLANLERLRPRGIVEGGAATHMVNAQIPGNFAMSPQAKANWPAELPPQGTVNSPLAQAAKRERSPEERKAWGEKMAAAKAAKKQAAAKEG